MGETGTRQGFNPAAVKVDIYIMGLKTTRRSGLWIPVIAGCLFIHALVTGPLYGQGYTVNVIDLRSPLSQDIISVILEYNPVMMLVDIERIAHDLQFNADNYGLEPGLLLALMAGEEAYPGNPQTRLYYFNLDMGSLADSSTFPEAWYDSERVARAYTVQFERYEDRTAAIAAYFISSQALPPDGDITGEPQALKDLVGLVLTQAAEWSHLGDRGGPQVVAPDEDTPETSFEYVEYDFSEVEQAYIANMVHFNSQLDDETAQEIFNAIRTYASDYQVVDARLVMALVACESNFRPDAVSHAGAQGLGQLMPFTADGFGINDPFNIDENIRGTFTYLAREYERWTGYDYRLDRMLAAYNAGPGAVERYTDAPNYGIPPYQETMNYVPKVINYYFYFIPEAERYDLLAGETRYVIEANGTVRLPLGE